MVCSDRVGLWCADNTIRFLGGTIIVDADDPRGLLSQVMTAGKLTVYVTDPTVLDPFIAHVVHVLPHNEHRADMSWDAIISKKRQVFHAHGVH